MQTMDTALTWIKDHIDLKIFLQGLAGVAGVYVLLFTLIWIQSDKTMARLETRLASKTVIIDKGDAPTHAAATTDPHAKPEHGEDHEQAQAANEESTPQITGKKALVPAPIKDLYEKAEEGNLPQIRVKDGLSPFKGYKKPFVAADKPKIAIIISDYGLSERASKLTLNSLPAAVTLLLSPYSTAPEDWQKKARKSGHELWMGTPFETADYPFHDPGPRTMLSTASLKYNQDTLKWNLARTTGYAGVAGKTDYLFAGATSLLQPIIKFVYGRGLGYLELNPGKTADVETMAVTANAAYAKVDVIINESLGASEGSPLKKIEFIAEQKGHAIGVLNPHISSLRDIKTWLTTLESKGFQLVPVSVIAGQGIKDKPYTPPSVTETTPAETPHAAPANDNHH